MPVRAALAFLLISASSAHAAPVVWLGPVTAEQKARVEAVDGFSGTLDAIELRASGSDTDAQDDEAYVRLVAALEEVRPYEMKLDGELVIMADLQLPIDGVTIVRDEDDRSKLFRALTYQGFAVNRYYDAALADDPEAGPWRADVSGAIVERPWRDAAALDPEREVTPYEIAEAPQRVAYDEVRSAVSDALPGGLRVEGVPSAALLMVDGETRDETGNLRIPPGRHYVHVEQDGHVLQRWTVELEPAKTEVLALTLTDEVWQGFVRGLSESTSVPDELVPAIEANGGEVWFARQGPRDPTVFRVTPTEVTVLELPREKRSGGSSESGLSVAGFVGGGWLSSGDFFLQEFPSAPRTRGTVNSAAIVPGLSITYDRGLFRAGVGADMAITPGEYHYAKFGDSTTRLRPYPHLEVGVRYATLTAGWTFPHHPTGGLRATVPLPGGLEIRADGRVGLGATRTLSDGRTYEQQPLYTAFGSIGWRWAP